MKKETNSKAGPASQDSAPAPAPAEEAPAPSADQSLGHSILRTHNNDHGAHGGDAQSVKSVRPLVYPPKKKEQFVPYKASV